MIEDKQLIVPLNHSPKDKRLRPQRSSLLLTLKKKDLGKVYIVCGKTDLCKGIDGLAYLIKEQFQLDPFNGQVFLFCGGKKDRFKALYWDGEGYWLLYKRI